MNKYSHSRDSKNGASGSTGGSNSGQVAIEYLITAAILISCTAMLAVFLYIFKEYGGRVLELVASEYP